MSAVQKAIDTFYKRCLFRNVVSTVTIHDSLEPPDYTDKILNDSKNVGKRKHIFRRNF